ncbi:MAG: CIA30 family protein, partial [Phycisphaerae bacterium]|nr:CIA30 family protein [Phycisphaerae bacterium]
MTIKSGLKCFLWLVVCASIVVGADSKDKKAADLLIDDFGDAAKKPKPLKEWEFVTDDVMKGTSTGKMEMVSYEGRNCLHMTGDVTLKQCGFIHSGNDMKVKGKYFDAGDLDGVLLQFKGDGKTYAVHIRTKSTWLPWQRYQAKFKTTGKWQTIKIPFSKFKPL